MRYDSLLFVLGASGNYDFVESFYIYLFVLSLPWCHNTHNLLFKLQIMFYNAKNNMLQMGLELESAIINID